MDAAALTPLTLRRIPSLKSRLAAGRLARHTRRARQFGLAAFFARLTAAGLSAAMVLTIFSAASLAVNPLRLNFGSRVYAETKAVAAAVTIAEQPAVMEGAATVLVRLSHYWPPLGGTNCSRWRAGQCVSRMASGAAWQDWIGRAAACPGAWPFGTLIVLPGGEQFTCMDRGGAIVFGMDGIPWVDLLVEVPPVPFGTVIGVLVKLP